jgi:hypothetical protein
MAGREKALRRPGLGREAKHAGQTSNRARTQDGIAETIGRMGFYR